MKEAKKLTSQKIPDYQKAIKIYSVAVGTAKDCGVDKTDEVNKALGALFTKIDGQRKTAEAAQKMAENAQKMAEAEKEKAEKALKLVEKKEAETKKALDGMRAAEKARLPTDK